MTDYRSFIRDVPDFPKPGILFKDITPLLASAEVLCSAVEDLAAPFADRSIDAVVAMESRGFIFGAPVACRLGAGFVPVRKPGKLPWTRKRHEYTLEYGTDSLEIHSDGVGPGSRVLIIDDVLATGGTAAAATELVRQCGATVIGYSMLIELAFLNGRRKLADAPFHALIRYE